MQKLSNQDSIATEQDGLNNIAIKMEPTDDSEENNDIYQNNMNMFVRENMGEDPLMLQTEESDQFVNYGAFLKQELEEETVFKEEKSDPPIS